MVGIAEAIRYAQQDLRDLRLLSIGTTSTPLRVSSHERAQRMGLRHWMSEGLGLIQDSSSMAATNVARFMLGDDRYLRLDSESARRVPLDDAVQSRPLQEWGHDVGRKNVDAIGRLLDLERKGQTAGL